MKTLENTNNIPYWVSNRNKAVLAIKKGLPVWVNSWSTDCDGCSSQNSRQIDSVQEIINFENYFSKSLEWADGPMGYEYVFSIEYTLPNYTAGYWGM